MINVIRLVNVHFGCNMWRAKWSFKTTYDDISNVKKYSIINGTREKVVTKEQGNKLFKFIRKHFPTCFVNVIISYGEDDIKCTRVNGHYEIRICGELKETCDNISEADEAQQRWREVLK